MQTICFRKTRKENTYRQCRGRNLNKESLYCPAIYIRLTISSNEYSSNGGG
jgi:hypothetical protein